MKFIISAITVLMGSAVLCYDEKYDKIDVEKIVNDDELFTSYLNCLLDKGPCTAEYSSDFKELLPEVLSEACAKCNQKQNENFRKVLKEIVNKRPDMLQSLKDKYDPKGQYEDNVKKMLE